MKKVKTTTTSALKIVKQRFYKGKPAREESYRRTVNEMAIGDKIRRVREERGVTQEELAKRVGTSASVISRVEDADYEGHSTALLNRIAEALDLRLLIDFEPRHPQPGKHEELKQM